MLVALTVAGAVFAWLGGDSTEPLAAAGCSSSCLRLDRVAVPP
ncbi:hypothetical protein L829_4964 [Mycobacteroides abscessus MAB_030201_1075]|uniref:Uncharacterized protein n=1 Tax=Mycobacteroides abscessus MAB_030201_1075 TaxID=1335410 RepID=A0A829PVW0_9MYCO|nr:hypothetical protein L829_4964 [Mycobacteroides abscessus MAB_030201_1075]